MLFFDTGNTIGICPFLSATPFVFFPLNLMCSPKWHVMCKHKNGQSSYLPLKFYTMAILSTLIDSTFAFNDYEGICLRLCYICSPVLMLSLMLILWSGYYTIAIPSFCVTELSAFSKMQPIKYINSESYIATNITINFFPVHASFASYAGRDASKVLCCQFDVMFTWVKFLTFASKCRHFTIEDWNTE